MIPSLTPAVALIVAQDVSADALHPAEEILREFGVRALTVSAGVTGYAEAATHENWCAVIAASADAGLPAAVAEALPLPVVRVPVENAATNGLALLCGPDGNLPAAAAGGASFATVAIGQAGAKNAALFVISMLALDDARLRTAWEAFRATQTESVLRQPPPALA